MSRFARLRSLSLPVFAILFAAGAASAKDLGVRGQTWPVAEPDLLAQIEARLMAMERSGELARLQEEARVRARSRLEAPEPVAGNRASQDRAHPPVRPVDHRRARHPRCRRKHNRRPPERGSIRSPMRRSPATCCSSTAPAPPKSPGRSE